MGLLRVGSQFFSHVTDTEVNEGGHARRQQASSGIERRKQVSLADSSAATRARVVRNARLPESKTPEGCPEAGSHRFADTRHTFRNRDPGTGQQVVRLHSENLGTADS